MENIKTKKLNKLQNCSIKQFYQGEYIATCKVENFGEKIFKYKAEKKELYRDDCLYVLDDDSYKLLDKKVNEFNALLTFMLEKADKIKVAQKNLTVYVLKNGIDSYDVLCQEGYEEQDNKESKKKIKNYAFFENINVNFMLEKLKITCEKNFNFKKDYFDIKQNPLYEYACKQDKYMQYQLEQIYGLSTKETRQFLFEQDGVKRLVGGETLEDKCYYIKSDEIDKEILKKSGYKIYHIPASPLMKGKTYSIFMLNPNKMEGKDASPQNCEITTWTEFMIANT